MSLVCDTNLTNGNCKEEVEAYEEKQTLRSVENAVCNVDHTYVMSLVISASGGRRRESCPV